MKKSVIAQIAWLSMQLILIVLLSGCNQSVQTGGPTFPDREIVFVISSRPEGDLLGFMHPDGTGLITKTVKSEYFVTYPTWGVDGRRIAFRGELVGGDYFTPLRPYVLSADGTKLSTCDEWTWHSGRVWLTSDSKLLMTVYSSTDRRERIVLGDLATCKAKVLFESPYPKGTETFDSASLSLQGWLAVGRLKLQDVPARAELVVVDPVSHEVRTVGNGLAPTWSSDGEWLAYTALDGIYVVGKDGSQRRRILEIDSMSQENSVGWDGGLPIVSWSPDGRYLVYSQLTSEGVAIYRLDVETGAHAIIFKGGYHPNWRWDMATVAN